MRNFEYYLSTKAGKTVEVKVPIIKGEFDYSEDKKTIKVLINEDEECRLGVETNIFEFIKDLCKSSSDIYISIGIGYGVDMFNVLYHTKVSLSNKLKYDKVISDIVADKEKKADLLRLKMIEEIKEDERDTSTIKSAIFRVDPSFSLDCNKIVTLNDLESYIFNKKSYNVIECVLRELEKLGDNRRYIFSEIDTKRISLVYAEFKEEIDCFIKYFIYTTSINLVLDKGLHELEKDDVKYIYYNRRNTADYISEDYYSNILKEVFINSFIEDNPIEWRQRHLKDKTSVDLSNIFSTKMLYEFKDKVNVFTGKINRLERIIRSKLPTSMQDCSYDELCSFAENRL